MLVDRLLTRVEVGRKEEKRLRFCGKQFDASGHDFLLDVEDNTRKTTYVEIAQESWRSCSKGRRKAVEECR